MANKKYELKPEFRTMASFNVIQNGKVVKVNQAQFIRESKKYIQLGYGRYFQIPEEEANAMAKDYTDKLRAQAKEAEEAKIAMLEKAKKQDELVDTLGEEVEKLDKALNETKELADTQQKELATTKQALDTAKADKDKVTKENNDLKKKLKALQDKLKSQEK